MAEAPAIPSAAPRERRGGRALRVALRVGLSAALLTLLLRKISPGDLGQSFARVASQWPLLVVAYAFPLVGVVFAALRWQKLMDVQGIHLPVWRYGTAVIVGTGFNQVLPSTIGGDVARTLWVTPRGESAVVNLAVVTLDRALGVFVLCLLALGCALASPVVRDFLPTVWLVPACLVAGAAVAALVAYRHGGALGRRLFAWAPLRRYRDKAKLVYETLRAYRGHGWRLIGAGVLSVGLQLSIVAQYVVLAKALGLEVDLVQLALVVPVVTLVTLAPVTINGIGLREGAFALLGATFGLGAGDAVALGWLFVAGTIGYGAIGGLIHLYGRPKH